MGLSSSADIHIRQRRALWRAKHRGTKELDHLLGCYAQKKIFTMQNQDLDRFEDFMNLSEAELQNSLIYLSVNEDFQYMDIVHDIRRYHGL